MKYIGPKARLCRKHGVNLYGRDKYDKVMQRKAYAPGKSPKDRPGRKSEYAKQLTEKQKARDIYGLSEKQFRRVYDEASASAGQTGEAMLQLLERRLDNIIYRAGFSHTRLQSRQFASHGLFTVNGVRVTTPSYRLKVGDTIEARARSKTSPVFQEIVAANEKQLTPGWLKVDATRLWAEVLALPGQSDAEQAIDIRQVTEYYSRN